MTHNFDGAPCVGEPALFESTLLADHELAAAMCKRCDHINECRDLYADVAAQTRTEGRGSGPTGTWAGRLVGVPGTPGRPRKGAAA